MADQRIKGQETEVLLVVGGQSQDTITDVRSFELALKFDLLQEGYLGETTDRYDEIFRGARGRMELHIENEAIFTFFTSVLDRAQRRVPGTQINIKTTLNFPNGDRPRVIIQNAFFGEMPLAFGSRSDYGTVTLEFSASDIRVIG